MSSTHAPITQCKECGSHALTWYSSNLNRSQVQQGRLRTNDVECVHFLGCDECSETLAIVRADRLTALLNSPALQVRRTGARREVEISDQVLDVVWQVATTAAHNRVAALFNERAGAEHGRDWTEAMRRIMEGVQADTSTLQQLRQILAAASLQAAPAGEVQA